VTLADWRESVFALAWHPHGGSGLELAYGDVLDLPIPERDWLLERVSTQRAREAREIENAAKRR
jgi:hypothetical protein